MNIGSPWGKASSPIKLIIQTNYLISVKISVSIDVWHMVDKKKINLALGTPRGKAKKPSKISYKIKVLVSSWNLSQI